MMITPTQTQVTEYQRHELLAASARTRLISAATQLSPSVTPRTASRIRVGLRQAVASLVALASIG